MPGLTIKLRRDRTVDWEAKNPILNVGEPGYDVDTKEFKIGDGKTRWVDLPAYLPDAELRSYVQQIVSELPGGAVTNEQLDDHINAEEPHPAYANIPSIADYYQSRKGQSQ